jgi:organic hydroperoxide reductase OsmC/OhrA
VAGHRQHTYEATLLWTGASAGPTSDYKSYSREYRVEFPGKAALAGSADPTFLGDPRLHNPEELLLAALSACHMLSYLALCARARIAVTSYRDEAIGTMAIKDGRMRFVSVLLRPHVIITDPAKLDRARALHAEAHAECFIANSVNFPVGHDPAVTAT